jgi:hypothetical protein
MTSTSTDSPPFTAPASSAPSAKLCDPLSFQETLWIDLPPAQSETPSVMFHRPSWTPDAPTHDKSRDALQSFYSVSSARIRTRIATPSTKWPCPPPSSAGSTTTP